MKTITVAEHAGFCFGVKRAIKLVEQLVNRYDSIKTLGPIIHNDNVISDLAQKGVAILASPEDAQASDTVVIRSHGVAPSVLETLGRTGCNIVDATCPDVKKIHQIVQEKSADGYAIIIAGDEQHPEVLGIKGHCVGACYVIQNHTDLQKLLILINNRAILVAQTTFSSEIFQKCVETLKKDYTNAIFFDTICSATKCRQQEAQRLATENDLMIVVGDTQSSNTQKLKTVCAHHTDTILIEKVAQLSKTLLAKYDKIGVTAGASTPAYIIKEVLTTMNEEFKTQGDEMDFATLLEQSLESEKLFNGKRVTGIVTTITPNEIHVDIGAKQAGIVPMDELSDLPGAATGDLVQKGDSIELVVLNVNDQEGIVTLSKKRCDAVAGFEEIKIAYDSDAVLTGIVTNVVKGGVLALCHHTKVFIPASQVSGRRIENLETLLKTEISFKILEVNEKKNRALGSVRAVLSEQRKQQEEVFWGSIDTGAAFRGEVKSLTAYGAFVDLGGVDGMIHITELSWNKIKHPSEVVSVGDMVDVYVKGLDREKRRISLGYKKSEDNPWSLFEQNFHIGDVVRAKIVSFTNYGAFAEITAGIDGLIHISQIANQRVEKIDTILEIGQVIDVKIIDINKESKRVSLSIRALLEDDEDVVEVDEAGSGVVYSTEDGILSKSLEQELAVEQD